VLVTAVRMGTDQAHAFFVKCVSSHARDVCTPYSASAETRIPSMESSSM
jgi:hypothetical protein